MGKLVKYTLIAVFAIAVLLVIFASNSQQPTSTSNPTNTKQDLSGNVGKHAYNKTNGVYRGEILEVKQCATQPEMTCYVVNQKTYMRPMEAPVDNSVVKDTAPEE